MRVQLSDHFNYSRIFRFTLPSIIMMIFSSLYVIVDGLFVSNLVGSNALASVNIIMPAIMTIGAFGFMLGIGGNAQVAKTLGEGDNEKARRYFSLIVVTILILGFSLSALCLVFIEPLCRFLGASEKLMDYCVTYGAIMLAGGTFFMLQVTFQTFFVTAEKPTLGLIFTVAAGVTNMVFDYIFIAVMELGIAGAALATVLGYAVGGIIPFFYFLLPNSSLLRFRKPHLDLAMLFRSSVNGASEMVSNLSYSIVTFLYNFQMMRIAGENGVAAITVVLYVNMIFNAIIMGYSFGIAPVIGFHYGAENHDELQNLFQRCLKVIGTVSILMVVTAQLTAGPVTDIFYDGNKELEAMTTSGFRLYALSFLFCGMNIFGSSFFTALCNGKISAVISFLRTLVMETGMLLLLPTVFGLIGVWLAVPITETVTFMVVLYFWITRRKQYHYI